MFAARAEARQQEEISNNQSLALPLSMLILLGKRIPELSRYLGHAVVLITMRVYAHFLKPKKQDEISDLERLIQNG